MNKEQIIEKLKAVKFPGIDNDIVSLKVITAVDAGEKISITITPRTEDAAKINAIKEGILAQLKDSGKEVLITTAAAPKLTANVNPDAKKSAPNIKQVIAVASGKGGVGKSTVAANLAYALKKSGKEVGILDLDFYGPNIPRLMGIYEKPMASEDEKILPIMKDGIEILSIGFFLKEDEPLIWRGPLLNKAIEQFFFDTKWGELDYLIIDLPPGTGDVQLTMAQKININGAIIVTTPQDIALIDVQKSINMFKTVNIPTIGIVENMSYFKCPHCGEITNLFPEGGGNKLKTKFNVPLLATLPFDPKISYNSDKGISLFESGPEDVRNSFISIANALNK